MTALNLWAGAWTQDGFTVKGRVSGTSVRLAVSTSPDLASPTFFGPVAPTAQGVAALTATGLASRTTYHYAFEVDGVLDLDWQGRAKTAPTPGAATSFMFVAAGDAGQHPGVYEVDAVSNHPVFDTIREEAEGGALDFFLHLGDLHYRDISVEDPALFRDAYDDVLTFNGTLGADARQGRFFRNLVSAYIQDDHDSAGGNEAFGTSPGRVANRQVYRERVPHPPLAENPADGNGPLHFALRHGRLRIIGMDDRTEADPPAAPDVAEKMCISETQEQWFYDQLLAAKDAGEFVCWMSSRPWLSPPGDRGWSLYTAQRQRIADFITANDLTHRVFLLSADIHALGLAEGRHNLYGGFPVGHFAALESRVPDDPNFQAPSAGGWKWGMQSGSGQWGRVTVTDDGGDYMDVTMTRMQMDQEWASISFRLGTQPPVDDPAPDGFTALGGAITVGRFGRVVPALVKL